MELLRDCWNNRIPPKQFAEKFDLYSDVNKREIEIFLLKACATLHETPSITLFAKYFKELLNRSEKCFSDLFSSIDLNDDNLVLGCINFFNFACDSIFIHIKIGVKWSVCLCLDILNICLSCKNRNLANKAIQKLARSFSFSANIAAGRCYNKPLIESLRSRWADYSPFEDLFQPYPKALTYLSIALNSPTITFSENPLQSDINDVFYSTASLLFMRFLLIPIETKHIPVSQIDGDANHPELSSKPDSSCEYYIDEETSSPRFQFFYKIYGSIISEYINSSSLSNGYSVVNGALRIRRDKMLPTEFDFSYFSESIRILFSIQKYGHPQGLSYDEVIQIFSTIPDNIADEQLIESAIQHPALTPSLPQRLITIFQEKPISTVRTISLQIIDHIEDFWLNLTFTQQQSPFLNILIQRLNTCNNEADFTPIFCVLLSLIIKPWRLGTNIFRKATEAYIKSIREPIQHFFLALINLPSQYVPTTETEFLNKSTLLEFVVSFYDYLCTSDPDIDSQEKIAFSKKMLTEHPILWVPGLVWAKKNSNEASWIANMKPVNYPITNFLFECFLFKQRNYLVPWPVAYELQDYDILVESFSKIEVIPSILINLTLSQSIRGINPKTNLSLMTAWSALISVFGISTLLKTLIICLVSKFTVKSNIREMTSAFQATAIPFCAVCEGNHEYIPIIIQTIEDLLDNDNDLNDELAAVGLANFVLVLMILWKKLQNDWFPILLSKCTELQNPAWTVFIHKFVKYALYVPRLAKHLSPDAYGILKTTHDWQTLIDFFIYQGNQSE